MASSCGVECVLPMAIAWPEMQAKNRQQVASKDCVSFCLAEGAPHSFIRRSFLKPVFFMRGFVNQEPLLRFTFLPW